MQVEETTHEIDIKSDVNWRIKKIKISEETMTVCWILIPTTLCPFCWQQLQM